MSLLKRRSRSESRKLELLTNVAQKYDDDDEATISISTTTSNEPRIGRSRQMQQRAPLERMETVPGMGRRKTSAELISEAKLFLGSISTSNSSLSGGNQTASVGGVRLINTRRPITPREPGRALYGKVILAGRPPSAFSLRYLQNEALRLPKTPTLEPIKCQNSRGKVDALEKHTEMKSKPQSSNASIETGGDNAKALGCDIDDTKTGPIQAKLIPKKLPALDIKIGTTSVSMDAKPADITIRQDQAIGEGCGENKGINLLTSRGLLMRNYDVLAQSSTEKLIELLKQHAGLKECSEDTVQHINSILDELYGRVRKNAKSFKRGFILGGLYGLVESASPKLLLAVARVVLALRVTGSNLTGACKLIFKVARNEQNDQLFYDNDLLELLIDGLGRASPLDDPEACIYGYGSIRFLTTANGQERSTEVQNESSENNNVDWLQLPRTKSATAPPAATIADLLNYESYNKLNRQCTLVERLARHGALELMVLHLQILNEAGALGKLSGPPLHSLYQLSATLRALADVRQFSSAIERETCEDDNENKRVIGDDLMGKQTKASTIELELACPHLIRAAEISVDELEVQANIVRTLSILSEDDNCCKVLANFTARIGMMLGPSLELFNGASEKLLSLFCRWGYILGNIMSKFDDARIQFYHNDVAMENLLKVMQLYAKESFALQNSLGDTVTDVLIKMIRVVANMSVNSEVGFGLGNTHALGGLLLHLLNTTNQVQAEQAQNEIHELTLATLGALHNLCFYQDKHSTPAQVLEPKDSLQSVLLDVTTALSIKLRTCNEPTIEVEATRVLGNITRNEKARNYFCKAGGLPLILAHLQRPVNGSKDFLVYELKACATGVLVNLLGDADNRPIFLQLNGVVILTDLLRWALEKRRDWFLATIICQAFWNLLIDAPCISDICDERLLDEICDLLSDYLDDHFMYDARQSNSSEPDTLWENFAMVATDLLERIQNSFEQQQEQQQSETTEISSYNANDDEDDVFIEEM